MHKPKYPIKTVNGTTYILKNILNISKTIMSWFSRGADMKPQKCYENTILNLKTEHWSEVLDFT